jgi:T4-like virus tail tube protein gp19
MPAREPPPLLGTSHFRVVIGRREMGFAEIGPLGSDAESPGGFAPLVLRRALTQSTELYDWQRKGDARAVTIQQLDAAGGGIVNSWRLENARPLKWTGPTFNANGSDVAIEELELTFEDLVWLEPQSEGGSRGRRT